MLYAKTMSVLRGVLFLAVVIYVCSLRMAIGTAAPVVVHGGSIQIQARVAAAHRIVLDENGAIMQIYSNTTEPVDAPRVYRLSIEAANEIPPDAAVLAGYQRLVPAGHSWIGTLYDRDSITSLLRVPPVSLFRQERANLLAFD